MDRITTSLVSQFTEENGLNALPEDKAFEHFTAYLITSEHYTDSFQTEDIVVGEGSDTGIDSITIIVNGTIVNDPEEIEDLATTNGYLDVTFVLTQSERSGSFSTAKIGQFGFGAMDFFSEEPSLPQNNDVALKFRIVNEIYGKSSLFRKGNPRCYLYYATTGVWNDDQNLVARRDSVQSDILSLNIFRDVHFYCFGADKLQELFQKSKNAISTEITFADRTTFPDIKGVEQAYMGLLPATEYLKLIQNTNEEIISSLFFDNVRDWQEWNQVNSEIMNTLENEEQKYYFPLLNNGVTVVCKDINPTGNKFLIDDYQVVNGCQTSHVLHQAREHLSAEIMIPIRLIATNDENIKNTIIKSTNRQTPVSEDELFALSDFPKKLEAFFPTFEGNRKLYYERRSRQYAADASVEKVRVINMTTLVRSFASIFQELPHRTTRNYKTLLRNIGDEIFNSEHKLEVYYLAAFAHYRLDYLYRNQTIAAELKPARYHLLLGFRLLNADRTMPRLNSHNMARYCNDILQILWNDANFSNSFAQCAQIVRDVSEGNLHRDNIRSESFTSAFIDKIQRIKSDTET